MGMPARHILLVEDDAVLCDLLRRNLQVRGHDVRLAGDARTALAELRAAPVDGVRVVTDTVAQFISLPFGWAVQAHVEKICTFSPSWTSAFSNSIRNGFFYEKAQSANFLSVF
jgi:CheY-like chemotaxis protein